jgi:hypothetical protein
VQRCNIDQQPMANSSCNVQTHASSALPAASSVHAASTLFRDGLGSIFSVLKLCDFNAASQTCRNWLVAATKMTPPLALTFPDDEFAHLEFNEVITVRDNSATTASSSSSIPFLCRHIALRGFEFAGSSVPMIVHLEQTCHMLPNLTSVQFYIEADMLSHIAKISDLRWPQKLVSGSPSVLRATE